MLHLAKKLAELIGVVLFSAVTSMSITAIIAGLLSIVNQCDFFRVWRSDALLVVVVLLFLTLIFMSFHILTSKRKNA